MAKQRTYEIVYLWQGEQHVTTKTWADLFSARCVLQKFHALKWQAWIEEIR